MTREAKEGGKGPDRPREPGLEAERAALEEVLGSVEYFSQLRPEERREAASHFEVVTLAARSRSEWSDADPPRLGVVVSGTVRLELRPPGSRRRVKVMLHPGEHWNDISLFTGQPSEGAVVTRGGARVAFLESAGLEGLLASHPSCALPICKRTAAELKWKNDVLRGLQVLGSGAIDRWPMSLILDRKRALLRRRTGQILRPTVYSIYRRTIGDHGREPMFWVLLGFILAILVSRAVVMFILKFGLQDRLFNLRPSDVGNPVHIHHFNYGFIVAFTTGLLAFLPAFRRILRTLAFCIGFGLGLIFDEFALIWNLHPDYYQLESYYAMALLVTTFILIVYFRRFFSALLVRAAALLGRRG